MWIPIETNLPTDKAIVIVKMGRTKYGIGRYTASDRQFKPMYIDSVRKTARSSSIRLSFRQPVVAWKPLSDIE